MRRSLAHRVAIWVLLATYAGLTASRVRVWASDVTLWTDAGRHAPCAPRPRVQLAFAQARAGQSAAVIASFETLDRLVKEPGCSAR